jgi:hypothetical protein
MTHAPFEQTWPAAHALPQVPQFPTSLWMFVQVPEQSVRPV